MRTREYLSLPLALVGLVLLALVMAAVFGWRGSPAAQAGAAADGPGEALMTPFDLAGMANSAGQVFRGTVVSMEPGSLRAGGGELPVVRYRLRVEEAFKGRFAEKGGVRYVDVTFLGNIKAGADSGRYAQLSELPAPPRLLVDGQYVLFLTAAGASGLSSTVGLGQGAFNVYTENKTEWAMNEYQNAGLYDGPVTYTKLAADIRRVTP